MFEIKDMLKIQNHRGFFLGQVIGVIRGQYRLKFRNTNDRKMTPDEEEEADKMLIDFLNDLEKAVTRLE